MHNQEKEVSHGKLPLQSVGHFAKAAQLISA